MHSRALVVVIVIGAFTIVVSPATAKCPPDAAQVGPTCVDKYEASLWRIPPTESALRKKVQKGTATLANLQAGGNDSRFNGLGAQACSCVLPFL